MDLHWVLWELGVSNTIFVFSKISQLLSYCEDLVVGYNANEYYRAELNWRIDLETCIAERMYIIDWSWKWAKNLQSRRFFCIKSFWSLTSSIAYGVEFVEEMKGKWDWQKLGRGWVR